MRLRTKTKKNKWNEIAKAIYHLSGREYFRSAKQCRERWNNYLDPVKTHGAWELQEDLILISCVKKQGKKWAFIAKNLQDRRTEHMVKNRYKSLVTKFRKESTNKKFKYDKDLLSALCAQLQAQMAQPDRDYDENSGSEEVKFENELSVELRLPREPDKAIQSCT